MVRKTLIRTYLESLFWAVLLALVLREWVVTPYRIPSGAMQPTLLDGDHVFAWRPPFGMSLPFTDIQLIKGGGPKRGDVVVFRYPNQPGARFIKRVVAVGGDKIEIKGKMLLINDRAAQYRPSDGEKPVIDPSGLYEVLQEQLLGATREVVVRKGPSQTGYGPTVVPPDHFFVLGDNRDSSDDSRYWGMIPNKMVEGQVFFVWFSRDPIGKSSIRWERLFSMVH